MNKYKVGDKVAVLFKVSEQDELLSLASATVVEVMGELTLKRIGNTMADPLPYNEELMMPLGENFVVPEGIYNLIDLRHTNVKSVDCSNCQTGTWKLSNNPELEKIIWPTVELGFVYVNDTKITGLHGISVLSMSCDLKNLRLGVPKVRDVLAVPDVSGILWLLASGCKRLRISAVVINNTSQTVFRNKLALINSGRKEMAWIERG